MRRFPGFLFIPLALISCGSAPDPDQNPSMAETDAVIEKPSAEENVSPEKESPEVPAATEPDAKEPRESVIKIAPRNRGYFSDISSKTMDLVCNGTYQNLRQAVTAIHKSDVSSYSESEKTVLYVSSVISSLVWPSERVNWYVPDMKNENQYVGAAGNSLRGIYDLSTSNSDFLSAILPVLSMIRISDREFSEYAQHAHMQIDAALKFRGDSVLANYLKGCLLDREGKFLEASKYFKSCSKAASGSIEIAVAIARNDFKIGKPEDSLEKAEKYLSDFTNNVSLLKVCADASYAMGDYSKAESYVARVLLSEPDSVDYILLRARILMGRQDYIRTSSLLDVCSRIAPENKNYLMLRSELQREWNKNSSAAIETCAKALSLYPDDIDVMVFAARTASAVSSKVNGMTAAELCEKVLGADKENIPAMEIYVVELSRTGEWKKAYDLSRVIISRPKVDDRSWRNHVDVCIGLKLFPEALNVAQKLYSDDSSSEENQQCYLKALVAASHRQQSLDMISRLLPKSNQKMKSFLYYQRSYFGATEENVLSDLRSSLTANPRNKDALFRLYEIYYRKRDWRRAQYYLKQVVAIDPANPDYLSRNAELDKLLRR